MLNYVNSVNFFLTSWIIDSVLEKELWKPPCDIYIIFKFFSSTIKDCINLSKSLWFYTYSWDPNISIFDTYKCFNRYMDSNLAWLKCNNGAHLSRLTRFHFLMIFYCKFIWFPLIYYLISHLLSLWKNMNNFVWNYEDLVLSWQLREALNMSTLLNKLYSLITKSEEEGNTSLSRSYSKRQQGLYFQELLFSLKNKNQNKGQSDSSFILIFSTAYLSSLWDSCCQFMLIWLLNQTYHLFSTWHLLLCFYFL